MKIGIYARGLSEKTGGVKEYIKSMTQAVIDNIDINNQLFIFHNLKEEYFKSKKENVKEIILKSNNKIFCDFFLGPKIMNKLNLDVVWFPKNVIPYFVKAEKVLTIHDLAYFLPKLKAYPFFDTLYMRFMIKNSCKRANRIIAISNNTRRDIVSLLKINPQKIDVVYEAADKKYKELKDKNELTKVKVKYNLPDKFILYTGGLTPRKNIEKLLMAFSKVNTDYYLVLTGPKNRKLNLQEIDKKLRDKIKRLGFIPDEEMPYLYNLADIFMYPSLYEGFGLPILEAQACGCPVIASNVSSIPEVGRDSVLYIDPYKTRDIGDKIMMLVKNESLKKDLIRKGFKNVKRFSLDKAANELLDLINEV